MKLKCVKLKKLQKKKLIKYLKNYIMMHLEEDIIKLKK